MDALHAAAAAWDKGQGAWPRLSAAARIAAVEAVLDDLLARRAEIIDVLMWEICKTASDAAKEFDRTVEYARASIAEARSRVACMNERRAPARRSGGERLR